MSQDIRCPMCGETENVECVPKPHHHVCHACGYDPYHGVPSNVEGSTRTHSDEEVAP